MKVNPEHSPFPPLVDAFGRHHSYLRLSVTDRCNFRCFYCMPRETVAMKHRDRLLRYEEMLRIASIMARTGVDRIRLTGGEPTNRVGLDTFIERLAAIPGIRDLSMTTNGSRLASMASVLARAGLKRVNVSLDTLDPERFRKISRSGRLEPVLEGIRAARQAGLLPIKINAVVLGGLNEDEILPLVDYFSRQADSVILRFIEYMPFQERRFKTVSASSIRRVIASVHRLVPDLAVPGGGPARYWRLGDSGLRIGFIAAITGHFCSTCNRLRLEADGHLRNCLAREQSLDLRPMLRGGSDDAQIIRQLRRYVATKGSGHTCRQDGGQPFEGVMARVGG